MATTLRILAFISIGVLLCLGGALVAQRYITTPHSQPIRLGSSEQQMSQAVDGSAVSTALAVGSTPPRKPRCQVLKEMHVCAHRANTDEFDGSIAMLSRPRELGMRAIMCMDIDVFQTHDEMLLVGYPPAVAAALLTARNASATGSATVSSGGSSADTGASTGVSPMQLLASTTSTELAALGLAPEFPSLLRFLKAFADNAHQLSHAGAPQLFIELKGAALSSRSLIMIAQQAAMLKVDEYVGIWFSNIQAGHEQDEMLAQLRSVQSNVKAVRGYLDSKPAPAVALGSAAGGKDRAAGVADAGSKRVPIIAEVLVGDEERFDVFGPSWRVPAALLQRLAVSVKPVALWTVNDVKVLDEAVDLGFHTVITDVPLQMKGMLQTQKNACAKKSRADGPADKKKSPIGPSD